MTKPSFTASRSSINRRDTVAPLPVTIKIEKLPDDIFSSFDFPRHGLRYAFKEEKTSYGLELESLSRSSISIDDFERLLKFQLVGIEHIIKKLDQTREGNRGAKEETYLDFMLRIVNQGISVYGYRNKFLPCALIGNLILEVNSAKKKSDLASAINNQPQDIKSLLLTGFFEKNSLLDISGSEAPFVFLQYALKVELILLGRQFAVLQNMNKDPNARPRNIKNEFESTGRNVEFLIYGSDNTSRKNLIECIKSKRAPNETFKNIIPVGNTYLRIIETPINAAKKQFAVLSNGGEISIAISNPATKPNSLCKDDEILSEDQFGAYILCYEAINDGSWVEIIMGLGTGKSEMKRMVIKKENDVRLLEQVENFLDSSEKNTGQSDEVNGANFSNQKLISDGKNSPKPSEGISPKQHQQNRYIKHKSVKEVNSPIPDSGSGKLFFDIDLNTAQEKISKIINLRKLQTTSETHGSDKLRNLVNEAQIIVLADEFHFLDGQLFNVAQDIEVSESSKKEPKFSTFESEFSKYEAIHDFTGGSGSFITFGASGSIKRIEEEIKLIELQIANEKKLLAVPANKNLIRTADNYLYKIRYKSGNTFGMKDSDENPVFQSLLPRNEKSKDKGWKEWKSRYIETTISDGNGKRGQGQKVKVIGKNKKEISNSEYLVMTAFFLYKLVINFAQDSIKTFPLFKELEDGLIPKPAVTPVPIISRMPSRKLSSKEFKSDANKEDDLTNFKNSLARRIIDYDNAQEGIKEAGLEIKNLKSVLNKGKLTKQAPKDRVIYFIDLKKLFNAVHDFFELGLHKGLPRGLDKDAFSVVFNPASMQTKVNKLSNKVTIKKEQLADLTERLDNSIKEFEEYTSVYRSDSGSNPNRLSGLVLRELLRIKGNRDSLLSGGQKGLYVLHDFRITDSTATVDDINEIMDVSQVDILILPHEDATKCKMIFKKTPEGQDKAIIREALQDRLQISMILKEVPQDNHEDIVNILFSKKSPEVLKKNLSEALQSATNDKDRREAIEKKLGEFLQKKSEIQQEGLGIFSITRINSKILEREKILNRKPSILCFFDETNAIGGDYKAASYGNVALRVGQVTDEDFLTRNQPFTFQNVMQGNRDRTFRIVQSDSDQTLKHEESHTKLILEFIVPSGFRDDLEDNKDIKQALIEGLKQSTAQDEKDRLSAYKAYLEKYNEVYRDERLAKLKNLGEITKQNANEVIDDEKNHLSHGFFGSPLAVANLGHEYSDSEEELSSSSTVEIYAEYHNHGNHVNSMQSSDNLSINSGSNPEVDEFGENHGDVDSGSNEVDEFVEDGDVNSPFYDDAEELNKSLNEEDVEGLYTNTAEESVDADSYDSKASSSVSLSRSDSKDSVKKLVNITPSPFLKYKITPREGSYLAQNNELKNREFLCYAAVYKNPKDLASIMSYVILKAAKENNLDGHKLLRAMEIEEITGDITNFLRKLPDDKRLTDEEKKEVRFTFCPFAKSVKDYLKDVGIYSIKTTEFGKRQGLSLACLPGEIFTTIEKELEKVGYNIDSLIGVKIERINKKIEAKANQVANILAQELEDDKKLNSQTASSSRAV